MITFCIPSKNNLRYLKTCISSILDNSAYDNKIIVYVDADNDGTRDWLAKKGIRFLVNNTSEPKGIAYGYNRCIEAADTEVVCMFHADMYMANGFDLNLIKHLKDKTVVCATRVEPPLHPQGKEKIVENFGMYPEDFMKSQFDSFCETQSKKDRDQLTYGIFAPWCIKKSELLEIGMHDEYFHSYQEDSDIFNRMILNGVKCLQSRDAYVYHFTCRGGQFQDGVEKITDDPKFHKMKNSAAKNYVRKWGAWVKNDEYQHPVIYPKYDVGFKIKNCNLQVLSRLECWASTVYCDLPKNEIERYIEVEQSNSQFDLREKIASLETPIQNDIVLEIDSKSLDDYGMFVIQELPKIIKENKETGFFELHKFLLNVKRLAERQGELVKNDSLYYTSKLVVK